MIASVPVLSCDEARALETKFFAGDECREWAAMERAGRAVAAAVQRDFEEIGGFPAQGRLLVPVGKGHNGGDALIAARAWLEWFPGAQADVVFVFGERVLRPLARRAWRELCQGAPTRVAVRQVADLAPRYDLCLDGVFGFQFRAPAEPRVAKLLEHVNALSIRLRAAIDLPSAGIFRADFTYATGSVKSPVLDAAGAGRVRYLDLGFLRGDEPGAERVLTRAVLAPLAAIRSAHSDKRTHGHVLVVGGSRSFPGAPLMTVLAALRSGAGLVTAFVPESLVPAFAARAPEAMWVGWPETPAGTLALKGEPLLQARLGRATSLVLGPGLGREAETLALVKSIVARVTLPVVLDADALQADVVQAGRAPRVLTPHAGEFERISGGKSLREFAVASGATVVLKGPVTRICDGTEGNGRPRPQRKTRGEPRAAGEPACSVYHSFFGGPVLARGGSGDLLAGLIGGLLAQTPDDALAGAARGVVWHGIAADALARAQGQVAVHTTQLLDFLSVALRESTSGIVPASSR